MNVVEIFKGLINPAIYLKTIYNLQIFFSQVEIHNLKNYNLKLLKN